MLEDKDRYYRSSMIHTPFEQPDSSPATQDADTERDDPGLPRTGEERIERLTRIVRSIIAANNLEMRSAFRTNAPEYRAR